MLRLEHLVKRFGGLTATDDVSLTFPAGSLSAIIGPNGAGKTTLFNQITGHLVPTSGKIRMEGQDITGLRPAAIVRKGIGRAFQIASIFPSMTVRESLAAAVTAHRRAAFGLASAFPRRDVASRTEELLHLLGMEGVADRLSSEISHGDQKLLDVGLALGLFHAVRGSWWTAVLTVLVLGVVAWWMSPWRGSPDPTSHADALRDDVDVVVYWRPGCMYCERLRRSLGADARRAAWVDIWRDPDAAAFVRGVNDGNETVPTVVLDGVPHTNPDPDLVRAALTR